MDPNYMHEFNPARHGRCKTIIGGRNARICGQDENGIPHIRHTKKSEASFAEAFEYFDVVFDDDGNLRVRFGFPVIATEEMRQFVEDAIREKLESL
jgi:hypothetical protein